MPVSPHHLVRAARGRKQSFTTRIRAVTGFSAANYYQCANGSASIAGAVGGHAVMFRLLALPTYAQVMRRCRAGSGFYGFQQVLNTDGLYAHYADGTQHVRGATYPLTAADVGRVHVFLTRYTTGFIDTFCDSVQLPRVAISAYPSPPGTVVEYVGIESPTAANTAPCFELIGAMSYYGDPTSATILSYLTTARSIEYLPNALSGQFMYYRWSLFETLNRPLNTHGTTAPATFANTYVGADSTTNLTRVGTPTIRETRVNDGGKVYGVGQTNVPSSHFKTANGGGFGNVPFVFTVHMRVETGVLASGSPNGVLARSNQSNAGWRFYVQTGTWLVFNAYTGSSTPYAFYNLTVGDVGRDLYVTCEWTGAFLRMYLDGVQVSSVACASMAAYAGPMTLGNNEAGTMPNNAVSVFGVTGKEGTCTAAEILAQVVASRSAGRIQNLPGAKLWDVTQQIEEIGGPTAEASMVTQLRQCSWLYGASDTLTMSTGPNGHFTVARHTERAYAFESAPVSAGFTPTASTAYFASSATGHDGGATEGKSVALLFRVDSQAVSKTRELLSIGNTSLQRMSIRMSGLNNLLSSQWYNGTAMVPTTTIAVPATDVGRLVLYVSIFDKSAGRARSFWKRTEYGAPGATIAAWATAAGQQVRLGQSVEGGTGFAEENTIFAAATYDGVWTAAEVGLLFDCLAAEDDLIWMPNRMEHRWSFKDGGNPGFVSLPASVPDSVGGSTLTQVGTPTHKLNSAHGPKWWSGVLS